MAHKILKENDLAPEWIEQGRALEHKHETILEGLRRAAREYQGALNDAMRAPQPEQQRQRVERKWQQAQAALRDQAAQYNREVLSYNLKVPKGVTHKATLNVERELARL
jgi:hypothetical protein